MQCTFANDETRCHSAIPDDTTQRKRMHIAWHDLPRLVANPTSIQHNISLNPGAVIYGSVFGLALCASSNIHVMCAASAWTYQNVSLSFGLLSRDLNHAYTQRTRGERLCALAFRCDAVQHELMRHNRRRTRSSVACVNQQMRTTD